MLSREEFFQQLVLRMADTELSPDEILEEADAIMKRMEKSKYHRKPLEDADNGERRLKSDGSVRDALDAFDKKMNDEHKYHRKPPAERCDWHTAPERAKEKLVTPEDPDLYAWLKSVIQEIMVEQYSLMLEAESERRQTEAQQKASVMTPDVGHYDTGDCLISEVRRHIAANRYAYLKPDVKVYSNGQLPLLLSIMLGLIAHQIKYEHDDPLHRTAKQLLDQHNYDPKRLLALIGAIAAMEIDRLTAQEDAVEEYLKTT